MEDIKIEEKADFDFKCYQHSPTGRILAGIFVVAIGVTWIISLLNYIQLPEWVFTWQMVLILAGVYSGLKHLFRNIGWIFPIAIGTFFLIDKFFPEVDFTTYLWPSIIIIIGLIMILKPKRASKWNRFKHHKKSKLSTNYKWENPENITETNVSDDKLEIVSIIGGTKKNIISKDFKGGDIVIVLGGSSINFSQADINGTVKLDIVQIMGGMKLIIPSNWKIKSDIVTVMASIEDKRNISNDNQLDNNKILHIEGVLLLSGIEIVSH